MCFGLDAAVVLVREARDARPSACRAARSAFWASTAAAASAKAADSRADLRSSSCRTEPSSTRLDHHCSTFCDEVASGSVDGASAGGGAMPAA
eukprot:6538935-Prymnesium_polylepis.1